MADIGLLGSGRRTSTTTTSNPSFDYTCNSGDNRKMIAFVMVEDADSVTALSYNSQPFEYVGIGAYGSSKSYCFYLDEESFPTTPGSYTIQSTTSGSVRAAMTVLELENCKQGAVTFDNASTGSLDYLIASVVTENEGVWVVGGSICEATVAITQFQGTLVFEDDMGSQFEYAMGYRITTDSSSPQSIRHDISTGGYDFGLIAVAVEPIVDNKRAFFIGGAGF